MAANEAAKFFANACCKKLSASDARAILGRGLKQKSGEGAESTEGDADDSDSDVSSDEDEDPRRNTMSDPLEMVVHAMETQKVGQMADGYGLQEEGPERQEEFQADCELQQATEQTGSGLGSVGSLGSAADSPENVCSDGPWDKAFRMACAEKFDFQQFVDAARPALVHARTQEGFLKRLKGSGGRAADFHKLRHLRANS